MIFASADENLGYVAVPLSKYIVDGLLHFRDDTTYQILSSKDVSQQDTDLRKAIQEWLVTWYRQSDTGAVAYIRKKLEETKDYPFGQFYLLYKLHKSPFTTRPVCSDCASTPHALGQWVNEMLQPIAKAQPAYLKNYFAVKDKLAHLRLPYRKTFSVFSVGAVSTHALMQKSLLMTVLINRLSCCRTKKSGPTFLTILLSF